MIRVNTIVCRWIGVVRHGDNYEIKRVPDTLLSLLEDGITYGMMERSSRREGRMRLSRDEGLGGCQGCVDLDVNSRGGLAQLILILIPAPKV